MRSATTLHDFVASLARRLLAWGVVSVAGGAVLGVVGATTGDRTLRAFGSQTIGWGAIDAGLALAGRSRARRLGARQPGDPEATSREAVRIRRILAVNAGLDVVYVVGGMAVAVARGRHDPSARGHGLAAVLQGAFLLGFDAWHAARVPDAAGDRAAPAGREGRGPGGAREEGASTMAFADH
jgi:Family of unknown function (DUF6992)